MVLDVDIQSKAEHRIETTSMIERVTQGNTCVRFRLTSLYCGAIGPSDSMSSDSIVQEGVQHDDIPCLHARSRAVVYPTA